MSRISVIRHHQPRLRQPVEVEADDTGSAICPRIDFAILGALAQRAPLNRRRPSIGSVVSSLAS
jgi:hypothetical protein